MRKLLIVPALVLTLSVGWATKPAHALPSPTGTETLASFERMNCSFTFPRPTVVALTTGNVASTSASLLFLGGPSGGGIWFFPAGTTVTRLSPSEREGLDFWFGRAHAVQGYGNITDTFTCGANVYSNGPGLPAGLGTLTPVTIPSALPPFTPIPAGEGFTSTSASVTINGNFQGTLLSGTFDTFTDSEAWTALGSVANMYFTELFWTQNIRALDLVVCGDLVGSVLSGVGESCSSSDPNDILILFNGPITQNAQFTGVTDLFNSSFNKGSGFVAQDVFLRYGALGAGGTLPATPVPSTDERRAVIFFNV